MHERRTVLVVDDEPGIQRCCRLILRSIAEVVTVSSCAEARVALAKQHFDVVVVDLVMPGEFGDALLREIRRDTPSMGRVLLSASAHLLQEKDLIHGWVGKPFDHDELRETVLSALSRHIGDK